MKARALLAGIIALTSVTAQGEGSVEAGKEKAGVCAACHGPDGNSTNPVWPRIAGQHARYIQTQLEAFKSGQRQDPLMSPVAATLSEQDMADLAAYFSSQTRQVGETSPDKLELGRSIYVAGNAESGVPACMSCHGPSGAGNPGAGWPALSGQHDAYTIKQLNAYRNGERSGGQAAIMQDIAEKLTTAEIEAVASYIQGLH